MDLLDKLRAIEKRRATFADGDVRARTDGHRARAQPRRGGRRRPADADVRLEQLSRPHAPSRRDRCGAPRRARVRHRHHRVADRQRHARASRGSRARVRRLVRQAPRDHLQHRLPGEPVAHRRPVRRRRRHPDRPRQPRQHLRRDAADGGAGHRLPPQFAGEPAQEAGAAAGAGTQPAGRRRRAVLDSRRRRAAARDRRRLPRARRVHPGGRGAFARHLRTRPASAAPRIRASSTRSTSSSARSRSRWPASAASACRIIPSCARCISWRAPTCSRRPDRRPTSRASAPRSRSCARIPSCAISCGRTSAGCGRGCASWAT